jgi:DNA polymerase III alpha subunit
MEKTTSTWKVTPIGKHHVYDIGLEGPHNFMIEGGIFASNCFNRSHSISYSFLTYITAYLKANYPVEFFCSLMTTRSKSLQPKDWAQKAPQYVNEARQLGVEINAPSVNASDLEFTISQNEIYFGLNAIRDVGKTAARSIVKARSNTPFKNVFDFVSRVNTQKVNIKTFMALVKAGAFDKMGYCRLELEEKAQSIYDYYKNLQDYEERLLEIEERNNYNSIVIPKIERRNELRKLYKSETNKRLKNKQTLSDMDYTKIELELEELESRGLKKKVNLKQKELPVKPEFERSSQIKLNFKQIVEQANYIGCYINVHPVTLVKAKTDFIDSLYAGEWSKIAAVITGLKVIKTRKTNKEMAFLEIDDSKTICEAVIFPNTYAKIKNLDLQIGSLILVDAKVEQIDPVKLIVNNITLYKE